MWAENQIGVIDGFVVYQQVGTGLRGDAFEPVALRGGSWLAGQQFLQGVIDALTVGQQRVADECQGLVRRSSDLDDGIVLDFSGFEGIVAPDSRGNGAAALAV